MNAVIPWGAVLLLAATGCRTMVDGPVAANPLTLSRVDRVLIPSNHRNWTPDLALLPSAKKRGDLVEVRNIRNFRYRSDDTYVVAYYDKTYDLRELRTVDFIVVPFKSAPSLAHTMLSFGFADGTYLGVSAEARLEIGETYAPWKGALRQYELMYVLADERDLIGRRTRHRDADVFLYPTVATPEQSRAMLVTVLERVNQLTVTPEFYDTVRNNCTTNIVRHVNELRRDAVPIDVRMLFPGLSDQYAYDLGLIDTSRPFDEAKQFAHVNRLANQYLDEPEFSQRIRRR